MNYIGISAGITLCLIRVFRSIGYKKSSYILKEKDISDMTSLWMLFGIMVSLPFFIHKITIDISIIYYIISILKGVGIWIAIYLNQKVISKSLSSSVFSRFIKTGIGTSINFFILKESLSMHSVIGIISIAIISSTFFIYGHFKELNKKTKIIFFICLLINSLFMVSDQIVIPNTNWYFQLFFSTLGFIIPSILNKPNFKTCKLYLTNKWLIITGLNWVLGEFFLLFVMAYVLPVSIAVFCCELSIPILLLISNKSYNESTMKRQLIFSGLTLIISIFSIL